MKTRKPIFSTDKNVVEKRRKRIGELSSSLRSELSKLSEKERKDLIRDAKFTVAILKLDLK